MSKLREVMLGSEVLGLFLPFRRPFLMVDAVTGIRLESPPPAIRAYRNVTCNEMLFDGHFRDHAVWPGIYTQEGLGQTSGILAALLMVRDRLDEVGFDSARALDLLEQFHAAHRFQPVRESSAVKDFATKVGSAPHVGVTAAVELKYLQPVFAGDQLVYHSELTRRVGELQRFRVRAEVNGRDVAKGVMTVSFGLPPPRLTG